MVSLASATRERPRLSGRERRLLVPAAVVLPLSVLLLRVAGYGRTRRLGERLLGRANRAQRRPPADADARVAATVRMVDLATARLPLRSACLSQSLTLWYLLGRQGIPSEIRFGVRAGGEPLDAHAWVERDGRALNETEAVVRSYAVLRSGPPAG